MVGSWILHRFKPLMSLVETLAMIRPCFNLIGCLPLQPFSWTPQTLSFLFPLWGPVRSHNYAALLISAPPSFVLRWIGGEGGLGMKGWRRKRSEAEERLMEEQEWEEKRVPGLRPMNRCSRRCCFGAVIMHLYFITLLLLFWLFSWRKSNKQVTKSF